MNILNIEYEKYKLKNNMEVILFNDSTLPLVASNIWYKVGSANEKRGKTGIAHLFEHMMFQGSEHVQKELHFKYIQEAGGNLNGSTSFDRTNYYEKVPSNFLELVLWLESDRMGYFLPALTQEKLDNQIGVVKNERLERYDNQPYGLAWEILLSKLFPKEHPYSWPTIGYMDDITGYTLDDVSSFFKEFYSPSNAVLVVAGDFEKSKAKELIEKYFGNIPGNNHHKKTEQDTPQIKENIFITHKDKVQLERIYLAWHSAVAYSTDDADLDILSDILSGSKNSRLYKNIVFDKELAQDISAYQFSGKSAGFFFIVATAKPGIQLKKLKAEIFNELDKVRKDGITSDELIKSKNGIKSSFVYSMQNIDSLADQINSYNFFLNEPNSFNFDLKRYEDVQTDGIQKAAEKYLTKPYVELHVVPNK